MVFESASGTRYVYDMYTNRINCANDKVAVSNPRIVFENIEPVDGLRNLDTFILELTQDCNFRCSYCCYGGNYANNRTHNHKVMSDDTLMSAIRFIADNRVLQRRTNIVFYGGEPLMYADKIKRFVEKATGILPDDTDYTISTNGSLLLKDETLDWCIEHSISLNISFDGSKQLSRRKYADGSDSHDGVLRVLDTIYRKYPEYWESNVNLLVTFTSLDDLKTVAKEWASTYILRAKAPYLISGVSPCRLSDYDIDENETLGILRDFMDFYAHNRDNIFAKTYFDMLCSPVMDRKIFPLPEPYSPLMCLPYNTRCYIDADGNLGICEKTPDILRFGNIHDGWDMEKVNSSVMELADIRKNRCSQCETFRFCKTCFTNFFYDSDRWNADCKWQCKWNIIAMIIAIDMQEQGLFISEEAEGCFLREIRENDVPALFSMMSDVKTMEYLDGLEIFEDFEDSLRFYLFMSEINAKFTSNLIVAVSNREDLMIGVVGIDDTFDDACNLFFLLDRNYWRQGIMTAMLAEYLAERVPESVNRITTHINLKNKAALTLASKFSNIEVSTSDFKIHQS